ncbi:MAG: pyridoxal phosphate-dependent aminotransferase [Magnetococcales bacterium]|nr:pyridoxal phosphate-dependent aminotransferase [Magnetococcales bacterium]
MSLLSRRIQQVKPSATLAVAAKAKELQAQGRDVVNLGTGEPDFDTPKHIKKAAIKALRQGFTKYTAVGGIPELKEALVAKFRKDSGLEYKTNEVIVTVGGKQAFYNLAQATLDPGDEVIIPAPYWVSYPDMVLLAEGVPVIVETTEEQGFLMTPEQLEAAITPKTRFVVINSPSNPTGAAYSAEALKALAEVLERHPHVWVISDDIYEKITFGDFTFVNLPQVAPNLFERTVILNGLSKAYSMTGWRLGYAAGPAAVIKAMDTIQSQSTSNAASFAQKAAVAALTGSQKCIKPMVKAFLRRRDFVVGRFNAMPGMSCRSPEGAFYAYPNVAGLMGCTTPAGAPLTNSLELANFLLESQGVAVVPGLAFGKDPYFRISFATADSELQKAMDRIQIVAEILSASK